MVETFMVLDCLVLKCRLQSECWELVISVVLGRMMALCMCFVSTEQAVLVIWIDMSKYSPFVRRT